MLNFVSVRTEGDRHLSARGARGRAARARAGRHDAGKKPPAGLEPARAQAHQILSLAPWTTRARWRWVLRSRIAAYNTCHDMGAKPAASACFVVAGLLAVTVLGLWISYAVRQKKECTDKDVQICVDAKLPGENENALKVEHTSYYLGGRTCAWFEKDPKRCRLRDAGDICFDKVDWTDKIGKFCEDWTRFISPEEKDVRKDGSDSRCNQPPQAKEGDNGYALEFVKWYGNNTMSDADLREMKTACCICGAHRDKRNYAGSFPNQPFPGKFTEQVVPPQHKGKVATHLTQCCACKDHGSVDHSEESNDLKKRGGRWYCAKTKQTDTGRFKYNPPLPVGGHGTLLGTRDDTKHAIFASAIVLTVVFGISLCVASFLCLLPGDSTDSTDSKVPGAEMDKPRHKASSIAETNENTTGSFNNVKLQAQHSLFEPLL